ncbi:UbiA-like protein EboC [Mucilaginibacter sp. FT3.2]|uniref:UbiA-like protein EboC n=1 Tax=Mucilaginibacter sp. FT3.2 TaxID=2723090 RepID=UPI0018061D70|nr:UbiA-like protein EboC [Mucilaginibacter sp. FT3.2]MBB6232900.1 4-hydroxybenzoate polyprenyltransferase [Mucilaginibacter sp. FT3.2]
MNRLFVYLRMVRPANVVTSIADVLAGAAISGAFLPNLFKDNWPGILLLSISTACLYGGGIVFNDVFDADLDRVERPERAIPSGLITKGQAATFGGILLAAGVILAGFNNLSSAILAVAIAFFALLYNKISKHNPFFGPLNMGFCRGLNLLLGVSIITASLSTWYALAVVPVVYIFSITMISHGEVNGGNKRNLWIAAVLYAIVTGSILSFSYINNKLLLSAIILIPFLWMIYKPLFKAIQNPVGKNIGPAVKAGVISLILMDAAWAITFSNIYAAIGIACLLPLSLWLAKFFAVT